MPRPTSVQTARVRVLKELSKRELLTDGVGKQEPTSKRIARPDYLVVKLPSPEYHLPQPSRPWSPPEPVGMLLP